MVWTQKNIFLFCDDNFFIFFAKYLGDLFCSNILERFRMIMSQKIALKFVCKPCDYTCSKQSDYNKHLLTTKHKNRTILNDLEQNVEKSSQKYTCSNCHKNYNARNSLWYHQKTCKAEDTSNNVAIKENINDKDQLILMLVKQNAELIKETTDFKSMMMKVLENGTHNNNSHNTNSHNKAFNLQLFLNETCKDAMNINDFVESIKLQVSDLENVGEVGFVEGISTIIVKNLNALDITKRPIHCTDKKRETIYIKDENSWEKDESQCKMRRMIKKVVSKNQRLIPKFKEQNPEYNKSYSKVSDKYNKLIIESMGGSGDNDAEKEDKIVRNIVKNVVVDK